MLKSISYWSFPGGLENTAEIRKVFRQAARLGYDAVELSISDTPGSVLTTKATRTQCEEILGWSRESGCKVSGLASGMYWAQPLTSSRKSVVSKCIRDTDRALGVAAMLKAGAMLVVPGAVNIFFDPAAEIVPYDEAIKRSRAALKQIAKLAERHKVHVGIENVWNKLLLSPLEMRDFVDDIGSRYLGVYFDVGNVIVTGYPEQWIRILGRRIKRVHFKDFKWEFVPDVKQEKSFKGFARGQCWGTKAAFCDLGAGDVNWPAVMKALKDVRYTGPVTAEMLPPEPGVLQRTSRAMDAILDRTAKKKKK